MNEWRHAGYRGVDAYERLPEDDPALAMLHLEQDGTWDLQFVDPSLGGELRQLNLGYHQTPQLAIAAAEGAIEQANDSVLARIDHYRLPIPHKRVQVARFNDEHRPTLYFYDHVVTDALYGDGVTANMDCRFGMTPNQEKLDNYFRSIGMLPVDDQIPPQSLDGGIDD